jgi:large subunit ribosomal protein L25
VGAWIQTEGIDKSMDKLTLVALPRLERKKQAAKRVRREGRIPAVVYGGDAAPLPVSVDARLLHAGLHTERGANAVFELRIEGGEACDVIAREVHRDPLTGVYVHVDLIRVHEGQKLLCLVPLDFVGTPLGVRNDGGVLEKYRMEVELECSPVEAPTAITADISDLEIGHALHVSDLDAGGLTVVTEGRAPVAAVHPPRVHTAEEEAAELAAAETETTAAEESPEE